MNVRHINSIAIDGLDGSGKGSCTEIIAFQLEGYTLLIDYPQYETPWGKVLTRLLQENDEGLSIQDRMLVYALNRLESIGTIQDKIDSLPLQSDEPINLVFDRFFTSNIITAAYYFQKLPQEERPENIEEWISGLYQEMKDIDSVFLDELNLGNTTVFVPMLNEAESIRSIGLDKTRESSDMYETSSVQGTAREFYNTMATQNPGNIEVFSQYKEDGSRMSPQEVSDYIIDKSGLQKGNGNFSRIAVSQPKDISKINELLLKYGSEKLRALNPYQHSLEA